MWKLDDIVSERHSLIGKKFRLVDVEDREIVIAVQQNKTYQKGRLIVYATVKLVSPKGMNDAYLASPVLRNGNWKEVE